MQPRYYAQTFHARKRAAHFVLTAKNDRPSSAQLCSSFWPRLTICQIRNAETLLTELTVILSARERTAEKSWSRIQSRIKFKSTKKKREKDSLNKANHEGLIKVEQKRKRFQLRRASDSRHSAGDRRVADFQLRFQCGKSCDPLAKRHLLLSIRVHYRAGFPANIPEGTGI